MFKGSNKERVDRLNYLAERIGAKKKQFYSGNYKGDEANIVMYVGKIEEQAILNLEDGDPSVSYNLQSGLIKFLNVPIIGVNEHSHLFIRIKNPLVTIEDPIQFRKY